jgi:hypothetical protein
MCPSNTTYFEVNDITKSIIKNLNQVQNIDNSFRVSCNETPCHHGPQLCHSFHF